MADEAGRLVDDQQVGVLVKDVKKFFQVRGILTTNRHE